MPSLFRWFGAVLSGALLWIFFFEAVAIEDKLIAGNGAFLLTAVTWISAAWLEEQRRDQ